MPCRVIYTHTHIHACACTHAPIPAHSYYIWTLKGNLNWLRVIFWPLLFVFFWQCQQCVADKDDPLSLPAKIWNWRIIIGAAKVARLLPLPFHGFRPSLSLWISGRKWLSAAESKVLDCWDFHSVCCERTCNTRLNLWICVKVIFCRPCTLRFTLSIY